MSTPPRPDQITDPPSAVVAPGSQTGIFRGRLVVISGGGPPGSGLFVYSPTVAFNDLIASIAAKAGKDGLPGNTVLRGIASYGQGFDGSSGPWLAAVMDSASLSFDATPNGTAAGGSYQTSANLALLPSTSVDGPYWLGIRSATGFLIGSQSHEAENIIILVPSGDTSGATDRANINAAINVLAGERGGKVLLTPGVFWRDQSIIIDSSQIILEGMGSAATVIAGAAAGVTGAAVIVGNTKAVSASGVKGLQVTDSDGTGVPVSGSTHGIVYACDAGILEDVVVQAVAGDNFHIAQDLVASHSTSVAAGSIGVSLPVATLNVGSTAGFASTGSIYVPCSTGAAYCTYTGTSGGNQFTGCTWSFPGNSATISGGSITQPVQQFDLTAINCYAQKLGATTGNGWYIDYSYGSCELVVCRAQGARTKPVATGTQAGFLIYGNQIKLIACHAYFWKGYGLQLNDKNVFTGGALTVVGGEWENNSTAGTLIWNPSAACNLTDMQFYGNGINTGQADIQLAFGTSAVNIVGCVFRKGNSVGVQLAQNIYMQAATHIAINHCVFNYEFIARAIEIDGSAGAGNACEHIFIRDNQFTLANGGSDAVLLLGAVTFCILSGNDTDASFVEQTSTGTPNNNYFYDNTFSSTFSPTLTLVGTSSLEWDNVGIVVWKSLGTPVAGWTITGAAQYRSLSLNQSLVRISNLVGPALGPADGTVIFVAANGLVVGYQPAIASRVPAVASPFANANSSPALEFETNGAIQVFGVAGIANPRVDGTFIVSTV